MKRLTIPLIIITMILASLACGQSSTATKEPTVEVLGEEATDAIEESNPETIQDETSEVTEEISPDNYEVSLNEQIVFDQEGIVITVKGLDLEDSFFGPEISVLIENNNEKDITVQVRNISINDIMVDAIFSSDVASGKKANDGITIMDDYLERANITTIKTIELSFHIFDSDSWDTIVDSEPILLETLGSESYIQEYDDSGTVAVDMNGVKIVIKKLDSSDSFWGADVYVYIENNSEQDITVQTRDVSINGFMVDPIFSSDIVAGKKAFDTITFMESDLTDNDITDINTIELIFHIFNTDSWNTIFDSDIVSITFD